MKQDTPVTGRDALAPKLLSGELGIGDAQRIIEEIA